MIGEWFLVQLTLFRYFYSFGIFCWNLRKNIHVTPFHEKVVITWYLIWIYLFCRNLIPLISRLSYQLKLLQLCVMKSFRWNAARHCDFISRSLIFSFVHFYIHFFYHTRIHWSFMLNCSELQRFPVCTCFGSLNLFIFISSRHLYSHVIFDTSDSNNFYFLSFPKGTTSFSTECNDGCVVKCGIHSL